MQPLGRAALISVSICLALAGVSAAQDGLKGLREYLRTYRYQTFVPPRANVSLGTVVTFKNGEESIVTSRCAPEDKLSPSKPGAVALATHSGNVDTSSGLESSFAKALDPNIEISGALKDARVNRVEVSIGDPTEKHIEGKDLEDLILALPPKDSCRSTFLNRRNLVFHTLLSVQGITYTFFDKGNRALKLDAALLKALKISAAHQKEFENLDKLEVKAPIFIGYRAWKVTVIPSAVRTRVSFTEADPAMIRSMKATRGSH